MTHKLFKTYNYLLVVDDSVHPLDSSKVGDPIAHLPLNGSPILEGVDLLPPYHQEDGIELLIPFPEYHCRDGREIKTWMDGWEEGHKEGYQVAREKYKYTEEDMKSMFEKIMKLTPHDFSNYLFDNTKILNHLLQYLHQYPTEFETVDEYPVITDDDYFLKEEKSTPRPKTITTAQGKQWVGKYKF